MVIAVILKLPNVCIGPFKVDNNIYPEAPLLYRQVCLCVCICQNILWSFECFIELSLCLFDVRWEKVFKLTHKLLETFFSLVLWSLKHIIPQWSFQVRAWFPIFRAINRDPGVIQFYIHERVCDYFSHLVKLSLCLCDTRFKKSPI